MVTPSRSARGSGAWRERRGINGNRVGKESHIQIACTSQYAAQSRQPLSDLLSLIDA